MNKIALSIVTTAAAIFLASLPHKATAAPIRATTATSGAKEKPLVDVDIGGSSGTYNSKSYTEINLGVNLNFTDWLTWRNAGFKRFSSGGDKDLQGVDSTFRFSVTTPFNGGAFRLFAGPGYRWADPSTKNAAVGEAGLGIQIGRVGLTGGAKYLKYDKVQIDSQTGLETPREDMVYFLTISGGAGFSF